jgi:hypothetical protein
MLLRICSLKKRRLRPADSGISAMLALLICLVCAIICPPAGASSPEVQFDGDRAFALLRRQCSFGPRSPGSDGHARCFDWITSTCRQLDLETTHQSFLAYVPLMNKTVRLKNIVAIRQRRNPRKVMLSAHWDTRPVADWEGDPARRRQPILGANDGASGVAVLLELARVLRQQPLDVGLIFVFFDGEDCGERGNESFCLGSQYMAEHLPWAWQFEKGINLDMVGDRDLSIPIEGYSWDQARTLAIVFWEQAAKFYPRAFRTEVGQKIFDDHLPFLNRGKPFIDVIDFDYPYWHTLGDTEDKCSPRSLEQVGRAVERFVLSQ